MSTVRLPLFGLDVPLSSSGYAGSIGGMANTLNIVVAQGGAGGMRLTCAFAGSFPGGQIEEARWRMDGVVRDGVFAPSLGGAALIGAGLLSFDSQQNLPGTFITDVLVTDRHDQSIAFGTERWIAHGLLDPMATGAPVIGIEPRSYEADGFAFAPDFRSRLLTFVPKTAKPRLVATHQYFDAGGGLFRCEQALKLAAICVSGDAISVRGAGDRLYVHGEVVDKRAADASNQILYQYALVNGELDISAQRSTSHETQCAWISKSGSSDLPVILALRWRDENGHPVAFRPVQGIFQLEERGGFFDIPDGHQPATAELSNRTIGPVSPGGPKAWRMFSIDPVAHYNASDPTTGAGVEYGPVTLSENSPGEIHGMARGVVLRAPVKNGGLDCTFTCNPIATVAEGTIGWLPEVSFAGAGDQWSLEAYLEERDSKAGASLSARVAMGRSDRAGPTLPLVDTMSSVVNLLPRPGAGNGAGAPYSGVIARAIDDWLIRQDKQFVGAQPEWLQESPRLANGAQVHQSGFALLSQHEVPSQFLNHRRVVGALEDLILPSPVMKTASLYPMGVHVSPWIDARLAERPSGLDSMARALRAAFGLEKPAPRFAATLAGGTPPHTGYVHGIAEGFADFDAKVRDISEHLEKSAVWDAALLSFMNQWVDPDGDLAEAIDEIRKLLKVVSRLPDPPPEEAEDEGSLEPWLVLRNEVIDVALRGDLDDIEVFEGEDLVSILSDLPIEEFAALCIEARGAPQSDVGIGIAPLLRWMDAPAGPELLRRVVRILVPDFFPGGPAEIPQRLANLVAILNRGNITLAGLCARLFGQPFVSDVKALIEKNVAGFLTDLGFGQPELLEKLKELWSASPLSGFAALRNRYGPVLSDEILDRIAGSETDAEALLAVLGEAGILLYSLKDLLRKPPEYLFVTRRFASAGTDWDGALRLWSARFDLARLAEDLKWSFFFNDSTSVLVKLGDTKRLPDILREIQKSYAAPDRPDPLGLGALHPAHPGPEEGLKFLESKLGDRLSDASWKGLFILRPTADIGDDAKMRDLCGFEYVEALFVAVAGRPLRDGRLDISAAIEKRSENDSVNYLAGQANWKGDSDFGLTKFSVAIKRSMLDAADIAFQLRVKNLMGRAHKGSPDDPGEPQTITLRGTLSPPDPVNPGRARDIEFAAVLEPPQPISIDLLCLKYVDFRALRVGRRDGKTFLDIDADLQFKENTFGDFGSFFESVEKLRLQGFKIALPALQPGEARSIGQAIGLDFDWPSVSFPIPGARAVKLFGLELTPTGLGIFRSIGDGWDAFKTRYGAVDSWDLPALAGGKIEIPHVLFRVAFGSMPGLGGAGKLSFDLAFGLAIIDRVPGKPFIAIDGLAGKDLEINLFRIITLKIQQLVFKKNWTFNLQGHPELTASGLVADKVELKILNWNPFGSGSHVSLASFHRTDNRSEYQGHGFVAGYEAADTPDSGSFVKIHWLVLGQNIELKKEAYDYLLGKGFNAPTDVGDAQGLLTKLFVYKDFERDEQQKPPSSRRPRELVDGRVDATFTKSPSWLFGISFSLGELLALGNLVLHDQHYYGIRLRDPRWVPAVFGQESIEFAYIPGSRPELDRFRTNLRIPFLDMFGPMTSGEVALEWAVNWDFLIDIGFPWKTPVGHNWFRAFSLPLGTYEGKFGFYIEKKTEFVTEGQGEQRLLILGAGVAIYVGLFAGFGNGVAFVRAGIGVFGIFEGRIWLQNAPSANPLALLRGSVSKMEIVGTIGIFAYAEGRIEIWIISASFRAWAEASTSTRITYVPGAACVITYTATLAAGYSASVRVGSGWFSWTFSVSGSIAMPVSGRLLLA